MGSIRNRVALVVLTAMTCMAVTGCNVVRVSLNTTLTPADVAFITPGHTTLTDVVTKLGAPDAIGESETGMIATYRFADLKYSRVNFGWLAKPWTPVDPDLIFSRTGLGVDAFQVACDPRGVVVHSSFQRRLAALPFYPYPF
ncbi:hypothetical protein YTPLAS72_16540 [Nitrospira sp.]|nr:hypothetical protein YTPLAS72_16540 [Nitrospira sp.]